VLFNNRIPPSSSSASPGPIQVAPAFLVAISVAGGPAGSFQNFRKQSKSEVHYAKKLAQCFLSALFIASAQLITAAESSAGRPVASTNLPSGSLYVLGAQGVVRAVDFQNGKPAIRAPSACLPVGRIDIVSAQVSVKIFCSLLSITGLPVR